MTRYVELVFLHQVACAGRVVYFGASGREMSMHYFSSLGGPGEVSIKSASVHVTLSLCFCILWDLRVT
jgi:hypothetical protein